MTTGKVLRILTECHLPVNTISFSPDGKYLAAAGDFLLLIFTDLFQIFPHLPIIISLKFLGDEAKIRIFDLAAGQQLMDLKKNHTAPTKHLSWSTNSRKLLSACTDGAFFVWNVNTHVSR